MLYEQVMITLILVADSCSLYLAYKAQSARERRYISRKANYILKQIGIR